MKDNKFTMGEEDAIPNNLPITSNTTVTNPSHKKQHIRHHVKRRSSGRVQVTKLAPMARANNALSHTDPDAELLILDDNNNKPTMKRSQSQKSLHRISSERKGGGFTELTLQKRTNSSSNIIENHHHQLQAEPTEPTEPVEPVELVEESAGQEEESTVNKQGGISIREAPQTKTPSVASSNNPASLSRRSIAEPIEQTIVAVANNLVTPKESVLSINKISPFLKADRGNNSATNMTASQLQPKTSQKRLLFSQFIDSGKRPLKSQQKLILQRQQALRQDETNSTYPRTVQKINKELEIVTREYHCIKKHQDPMLSSLFRCLEARNKVAALNGSGRYSDQLTALPASTAMTFQTSATIPHFEQRQIAHRHHHLKVNAISAKNSKYRQFQQQQKREIEGASFVSQYGLFDITAAFLNRMIHGSNNTATASPNGSLI